MYKDYVKNFEREALIINHDDNVVMMELKWLNLYDRFNEFIEYAKVNEPSPWEKALGAKKDARRDELARAFGIKPPEKSPGGRCAYLLCYVKQHNRIFAFQFYWGFKKPEDNGYVSFNVGFNKRNFELVRSRVPSVGIFVIEGPLPVFKNYHIAARKLDGQLYQRPVIAEYDNFNDLVADWKVMYNK